MTESDNSVERLPGLPTKQYRVQECECGCRRFVLEYGEPISCVECGNIPPNLHAHPLEDGVNHVLTVKTADGEVHKRSEILQFPEDA